MINQAIVTVRIERADKRTLTAVAPLDIQLAEDPIAFKTFTEKLLRKAWDKQDREG